MNKVGPEISLKRIRICNRDDDAFSFLLKEAIYSFMSNKEKNTVLVLVFFLMKSTLYIYWRKNGLQLLKSKCNGFNVFFLYPTMKKFRILLSLRLSTKIDCPENLSDMKFLNFHTVYLSIYTWINYGKISSVQNQN